MEPELIPIFAASIIATISALTAVVFDRFQRPVASTLVLAGGLATWIHLAGLYSSIQFPAIAQAIGLFGSGPLFFVAAMMFKSDWRSCPSKQAVTASTVGVFAGGAFTFFFLRLMSKIP